MGNQFSKKEKKFEIFPFPYIGICGNKCDYDETEHLNQITIREIFKGNFSSHIKDNLLNSNTKILDIGCGSGFWLTEMVADFPKPHYFGIDMLPVFPTSTVPNNVIFQQHNFLEGLPYEDNTFDFVHMQFMVLDITELQWETFVYKEIERVLKPGGWFEICDLEYGILNYGPTLKQIEIALLNNLKSRNVDPHVILRNDSLIRAVPSFASSTIHRERCKYPLGSYASILGELCAKHMKERVKSTLQGPIGQSMKIKKDNIDSIIGKIGEEFETNESYIYAHRCYVQKSSIT